MNFVIGSLFPKNKDGEPNVQLSSSLELINTESGLVIQANDNDKGKNRKKLVSKIDVTSDPVEIKGASKFISDWFKDGITSIYNEDGSKDTTSIFGGVYNTVMNKWASQSINRSARLTSSKAT